jgi:hypothetical protein
MPRRAAALLATIVVALLAAGALVRAQSLPDCSTTPCTHLPLVLGPPPTPTVTATAVPPRLVIQANSSAYIGQYNWLYVVGEVFNETALPARLIDIPLTLYNEQGQPIAGSAGAIYQHSLRPGDRTCFKAVFYQVPGLSSYGFGTVTYSVTTDVPPMITVLTSNGVVGGLGDHVSGQIRNDANTFIDSVLLAGTLYNAAGRVVGCQLGFPDDRTLVAQQVSPYDIVFTDRPAYGEIATWRVQVDGNVP